MARWWIRRCSCRSPANEPAALRAVCLRLPAVLPRGRRVCGRRRRVRGSRSSSAGRAPFGSLPPHLWHGHEMLFGFIGAAIAGFLLTAVPSWTGSRGFAGAPLVLASALWLAGRIAFAGAAFLPWPVVAAIELAFLPLLAFLIGRSLIRERNRNFPMLVIVAVLWGHRCLVPVVARGPGLPAGRPRAQDRHRRRAAARHRDRRAHRARFHGQRPAPSRHRRSRSPPAASRGAAIGSMALAVLVDALAPGQRAAGPWRSSQRSPRPRASRAGAACARSTNRSCGCCTRPMPGCRSVSR